MILLLFTADRQITPDERPDCEYCEGEGIIKTESNCCGARMDSDIKICSKCKEHADHYICEECDGTGTKAY